MPIALVMTAALAIGSVPPPAPIAPLPSPAQLAWHQLGMYAFVHFNMNTFTAHEWGEGNEEPLRFDPAAFDARQWARTFRSAGMTGLIITAKHHDGFCLWPSAHTDHSVAKSGWRGGKGDVLREVSDACRAEGLQFGVYLSPWDRNSQLYGDTPRYNQYFRDQLREVCTNYGPLFEVWFDGACGEGPNGKKQEYDWPSFVSVVRETQPNAVIFSDAGPDVRWVGNERGFGSETNWAFLKRDEFFPGITNKESVLGTGQEDGTHWVPAECDVSIRPGWYWRQSENNQVKSLKQLEEIWYASIGRGCNLILNVPPDRRGLVCEPDVVRLHELKQFLDVTFKHDLAARRPATASNVRGDDARFAAANVTDDDDSTYWATNDDAVTASIEIPLDKPQPMNRVELREAIALGQRVERFDIEAFDGTWKRIAEGSTIGPRRVLRFPATIASGIRVNIRKSRACPALTSVRVFCAPPEVTIAAPTAAFEASATVTMEADIPGAEIRYTLDGSEPTGRSDIYEKPITVHDSCIVRAVASLDGRSSLHHASATLVRSSPSFLNAVVFVRAPDPGVHLSLFEGAMQSLKELNGKSPVEERIVEELGLPRKRPKDNFALVFDGVIDVPDDGIYTFAMQSYDGSRLYLHSTLVVDHDIMGDWEWREGRIGLRKGFHPFRLEFFNAKNDTRLRVRWSGPGFTNVEVPKSVLFH